METAAVIMAGKKTGFMGVLFITDKPGAMKFCGFDETHGTTKYGGEWSCFFVTKDLDDYTQFINDDGRFDKLIEDNDIPVLYRVSKKGGGTTKIKDWKKEAKRPRKCT